MGKSCFVPRCRTGYKSCHEKFSLFSAPKDEQRLNLWRRAIPRKDRLLQASDYVCERHFEPELVSKTWTAEYKGNVLVSTPRRASLANNAVPTRFPDCPPYLSKTPKSRKRPAERHFALSEKKSRVSGGNQSGERPKADSCAPSPSATDDSDNATSIHEPTDPGPPTTALPGIFESLFSDPSLACLPSKSWGFHRIEMSDSRTVVFSQLTRSKEFDRCSAEYLNAPQVRRPVDPGAFEKLACTSTTPTAAAVSLVVTRLVEIDDKMQVRTVLMGKPVSMEELQQTNSLETVEDVEAYLKHVNEVKLCSGGPSTAEYPQAEPRSAFVDLNRRWRHNKCEFVLCADASVCQKCLSLSDTLRIRQKRAMIRQRSSKPGGARLPLSNTRSDKLAALRRANYALKRSKNRLLTRFKLLSTQLKEARERAQKISEEELDSKLCNLDLPGAQLTAIKECIAAARLANKKSRRYTEDWLLMCLLLHIRSPSAYSFLRDNNVLPLPCVTTVRKYLSMVRVKCGFDSRFFAAFKKKMATKDEFQRHGILVFDEMVVRKEIRVHSKSMTYVGFSDFGDAATASDNLADHGLVFTFRAFGDNYSQPIAVFASKGPTKGAVLAQLVLKAIFMLEEAGALVDAVVCDGAATNRNMWKEFGVSGAIDNTKHFFTHPADDKRNVYVFSDAPHLMKCVRNRLHAQKVLQFHGGRAQWAHYDKLFVVDSGQPGHLRVCHKLSSAHVNPSNTEKMRVRLATQLFSRSVANGLQFFSKRGTSGLQNVAGTVEFTIKFNDLFDALNRNNPKEGITVGSRDLRVLASFLHWLNKWEREVMAGKISRENFLTQQTAAGLRVTILSALELTRYLLKECGFTYVLTGKFNQDVLERFFGILRQAAGQNDHPSLPTFLQLYNMLSVYSLIKPPKFGNCEVEPAQSTHVLTLTDLKLAFQERASEETKLQMLKQKLDGLVVAEVECSEAFANVCTVPEAADCIIYYLAGFMCRKLLKCSTCSTCRHSLIEEWEIHSQPESSLVNCKTRGGLLHPKRNVFCLLKAAETEFQKHSTAKNVYEQTLEELLKEHVFSFPCNEHKEEIMAQLLHNYVAMRMTQVCKQKKRELKTKTQHLRKLAKLV